MFERFTVKQQTQPQSYSPQNPPTYTPNDEIALRELLKALWDGKLIVILITTLFTVVGIVFSLQAQEWWSASAKITKAQPQDISSYQQQVIQFQPVLDFYQEDGTMLLSKELNGLLDQEVMFKRFIDVFNSSNNKRDFLASSVEFNDVQQVLNHGAAVDGVSTSYAGWFSRISAVEDRKESGLSFSLKFQSISKESSLNLLTSYISATESKVQQDVLDNLQAVVNSKKNEFNQQKIILEAQAKSKLLNETERAKYALDIAQAAGVERQILTGNDNELFAIDMGSKGLEAKIRVLESVKNLSVIEPRLQQTSAKLDILDTLKIDRTVEFQTFRYLESVEQPLTRDKPKRALIVVLSTLLGGMLGVAIVLVRFAFRKED